VKALTVGVAGLGALTVVCLFGPFLLPSTGEGDPVHGSLLPPGTVVTVLDLGDGRTMLSPDVRRDGTRLIVVGPWGETAVAPADVQTQRRIRLWLGSDRFGRDVLVRLLEGGRVSILIAVLGVCVALIVGLLVGLTAATGGPLTDSILMRSVDALLAFPLILLLILLSALVRPGVVTLVVVLGLTSWMGLARLVRGQVLSLRNRDFIKAARVSGTPELRIWAMHYLPNLKGPVAQDVALTMGGLVLAEATLSFLGLGIPATLPSWGAMVADGQRVMISGWWLAFFPGLAIATLVMLLALVGDGLQERRAAGA
jgi:peptide/nickel transport system permease protein